MSMDTPDYRTEEESHKEKLKERTTEETRSKLSYLWSGNQGRVWRMCFITDAKETLSYVRMCFVRLTFSASSRIDWLFIYGSLYNLPR